MRRRTGALLAVVLGVLPGCATFVRPRSFSVAPESVALRTADGLSVRAGEIVATPVEHVRGVPEPGFGLCFDLEDTLPSNEPFEEDGLRDPASVLYVTVEHPAMPPGETLYGALVLCEIVDAAPEGVRSLYRIEIPASFVEATTEGRRAFVSETYTGLGKQRRAWALWIQRTPFR